MESKVFIIAFFVLSLCFIEKKGEGIDLPLKQPQSDRFYSVNEDSVKSSNNLLQAVSTFTEVDKNELLFSEENNRSSTYFGTYSFIEDINGDSYEDLIISERGSGRVYVYFGGEELDTDPDLIIYTEQGGSSFGASLSSAGDINDDGFNDIMVGAQKYCIGSIDYHGRAYIYYGGPQMDNKPDLVFQGSIKSAYLGGGIAKLGDVNNDGCDDIGMTELNNDTCYIFFGGVDVDTIPDILIYIDDNNARIHNICSGGDFNNDGISDILIGSPNYGEYESFDPWYPYYLPPYGRAYLFYGGETINPNADIIFEGQKRGDKLGSQFSYSNGDINNDSIDDILVGSVDHVEIFYGGNQPDGILDVSMPYFNLGHSMDYVGDINNDSIGDIVLITKNDSKTEGYANIYFGGENFDAIPDKEITFYAICGFLGISVYNGGDINSDDQNDLIFQYQNGTNGELQVYFGGDILDTLPDVIYTGITSGNDFGISVSSAGDINSDGFYDLLVGASGYNFNTGRGYVYYGGFNMDTIPDLIFNGERIEGNFGYIVKGLGDLNNDNYDDYLIADYYLINVYFGSETPHVTPDLTIQNEYGDCGYAGDLDNDGYNDVFAVNDGRVDLFFGGEDMDSIPDFSIAISNNRMASAGDVNNDGFDDLLIGYPDYNSYTGRAYVYFGGNPMDDNVDLIFQGEESYSYFGKYMSDLGDVNNDGFDDVIIGATANNVTDSKAYIYYGGVSMDSIPDLILYENSDTINSYGIMLERTGDVNGDTIDDVLVGAFVPGAGRGIYYIYHGGSAMDTVVDEIHTIKSYDAIPRCSVASLRDVDGDSGNDLAFGSCTYTTNGLVKLHFGTPLISIGEQPINQESCTDDTIDFSIITSNTKSYSWEMSSDSGKTFIPLIENNDFAGTETSSLQIIARTDLSGNSFRCKLNNEERFRYTDTAHISVQSRPSASFLGDSLYCMEDSVELTVELTGSSPWFYILSNNLDSLEFNLEENNHSFFIDNPGTYKFVHLEDNYCPGISMEDSISVYSNPTSLLSGSGSLCINDSVTLSIDFTGTGPWYYSLSNGIDSEEKVSTESNSTYNVDSPGIYSIISLNDKNCIGSNMSGEVEVEDCSSLSNIEYEEIVIYPNPTSGNLAISNLPNRTELQVFSGTGQLLLRSKAWAEMLEIELSSYKPGICFLKIIMPGRIQVNKIIIE